MGEGGSKYDRQYIDHAKLIIFFRATDYDLDFVIYLSAKVITLLTDKPYLYYIISLFN
jgi:hypothetical protein